MDVAIVFLKIAMDIATVSQKAVPTCITAFFAPLWEP